MGARHSIIENGFRQAVIAEMRGSCPRAECPLCGRHCAVYWPTGGDGSARVTFWHKRPDGQWCRAEVDVADVKFTEEAL
jgi:hypothetical protein